MVYRISCYETTNTFEQPDLEVHTCDPREMGRTVAEWLDSHPEGTILIERA